MTLIISRYRALRDEIQTVIPGSFDTDYLGMYKHLFTDYQILITTLLYIHRLYSSSDMGSDMSSDISSDINHILQLRDTEFQIIFKLQHHRRIGGVSSIFNWLDQITTPFKQLPFFNKITHSIKVRQLVIDQHIQKYSKLQWDYTHLPIILTILQVMNHPKYVSQQFQSNRLKYPTCCCYCMKSESDFKYTGMVAGIPFLIWLTQRHEYQCKQRPCHLANLPQSVLLYISEFIVDRNQFQHDYKQRALQYLINNHLRWDDDTYYTIPIFNMF